MSEPTTWSSISSKPSVLTAADDGAGRQPPVADNEQSMPTDPSMVGDTTEPQTPLFRRLRVIETGAVIACILATALIPATEIIVRRFPRGGISWSADAIQHLVLWIAFLGGMIATRNGSHLALSSGLHRLPGIWGRVARGAAHLISVSVTVVLAATAASTVLIAFLPSQRVTFLPIRWVVAIMPIGFAVMAVRFVFRAPRGEGRLAALAGIVVGMVVALPAVGNAILSIIWETGGSAPALETLAFSISDVAFTAATWLKVPLILIVVASAFAGVPIFVVIAGFSLFQFMGTGGAMEVVVDEAYAMLSSAAVPAIPLFTIAGFLLSESGAGERLVRLFRALFGWLPGGLAIMSILICAFFTTFTGASGVTILALGGLLVLVLRENGYPERFSEGLLTASGSIGLQFPPSLPIIMYGVIAGIDIRQMFVGGFLPGVLMVLAVATYGVITALKRTRRTERFSGQAVLVTVRESVWEVVLPILIIVLYFRGLTTLVETGAVAVVYLLIVEMVVHREIRLRDLPRVFGKAVPIIGGVLMIFALAKALNYYIVDASIPSALVSWFQEHINSKYVFLILLNLALLATGCLMDIYSAIVVIAPLFIPLGVAYGIDPVHLGVIFLANLELGYLTPPVGLNLFLASYRFGKPLPEIYRNVLPFLLILFVGVLIITYVPWLSTVLLGVVTF